MVTVATYNVNSVRARAELLRLWLEREAPDILCLQETKVVDEDFPHDLFEPFGYRCWTHGQPGYNGVAICTRFEVREVVPGIGGYEDGQARVLAADFGEFRLLNVYVPHGDLPGTEKHNHKLAFLAALREALAGLGERLNRLILVGDMNVARADIDVWDPDALAGTVGVLPDEREAFERLLEVGLVDCYRMVYPNGRDFTWWDYRGGAVWKDQGMRIDYVLAGKVLADRCRDVRVDRWPRRRRTPTPSDHAPVIATFDFAPPEVSR